MASGAWWRTVQRSINNMIASNPKEANHAARLPVEVQAYTSRVIPALSTTHRLQPELREKSLAWPTASQLSAHPEDAHARHSPRPYKNARAPTNPAPF
eukprot:6475076-Amphidinium_carterae.1